MPQQPLNFERLRVLVVDDNRHCRALMRAALAAIGFQDIVCVESAGEARNMLNEGSFDLVLADALMEEEDGMHLTRALRTEDELRHAYVPVIMVSAHSTRENVLNARDSGISEYLVKPINPEQLYRRVVKAIANPRVFVKTRTYKGPCRRRFALGEITGGERRKDKGKGKGEGAAPALPAAEEQAG